MRTFVQNPTVVQQTAPAHSTIPSWACLTRRVVAISRAIPLWAYIALFLIGVVSVVVHEDLIQKEVARRYLQIVNNFDKSPYGGVYWIINVYRVDRALLENSGPLTTYETYMFDVQPKA